MVTFSCDKCQWTGKKGKVEKHYMRCRGEYFTCIDCGKSFAEDYAQHTSCVQEDDKYHGQWAKARKGNQGQIKGIPLNGSAANGDKTDKEGGTTVSDKPTANGNPSSNVSLSENESKGKKRKRDTAEDNDDQKSPSSKKAKIDGESGSNSKKKKKKKTKDGKEKELKRLRKILKNKKFQPLTLDDACTKFNDAMGIEDPEDNKLFLETLWNCKKKIKLSY